MQKELKYLHFILIIGEGEFEEKVQLDQELVDMKVNVICQKLLIILPRLIYC